MELTKWEKIILDHLTKYYEQREGHVYLVEQCREEFANSIKIIKREMENSVLNTLEAAVEIFETRNTIKKKHTAVMEKKVPKLLQDYRKSQSQWSDEELERDFENVWEETVQELSFAGLRK